MVNRIDVLSVTANKVQLPATKAAQYLKQLDKALGLVVSELPLEEAQRLSSVDRKNLETALREAIPIADLKKISKKWEPKRKIEASATQTEVTNALVELLHKKRRPYAAITFTLAQARSFDNETKLEIYYQIDNLAPLTDLKNLAKKWDRYNKYLPSSSRKEIVQRLISLLNGTSEPFPPPPKKSTRKK